MSRPGSVITGTSYANLFLNWSNSMTKGRDSVNMTSRGRGTRNKVSEFAASPIQSHSDDTSGNHTPSSEDIRLRAYEIYLERGSLPGNELDDWLLAERELDGRAPQRGESTDIEQHKP